MATISSKKLVDELLKNNGHYHDDPQVAILGEYENYGNQMVWFILYRNEVDRLLGDYMILPKSRIIKTFHPDCLDCGHGRGFHLDDEIAKGACVAIESCGCKQFR